VTVISTHYSMAALAHRLLDDSPVVLIDDEEDDGDEHEVKIVEEGDPGHLGARRWASKPWTPSTTPPRAPHPKPKTGNPGTPNPKNTRILNPEP
jgi:hypothetical protein